MRFLRLCPRLGAVCVALAMIGQLAVTPAQAAAPTCAPVTDRMELWRAGGLKGANLWQGRMEGNANQFRERTVGVPVSQADLSALAALGANYVQLSVAGPFTEQPPYVVDPEAQQVVDDVVRMAANAGMYVAIAFRSGPGRNEQAIARHSDVGTYGPILETVWTDPVAQDGWMQMLTHAAGRWGVDPAVVGISPMMEPNASSRHGYLAPEQYSATIGGTLEDINLFQQRAAAAIRAVSDVPILVEGDGYGSVGYLSRLVPTGDPRSVYTAHFYDPFTYTHQEPGAGIVYPGPQTVNGRSVQVDRAWLAEQLAPVGRYGREHGVPVAVTEFGVRRFAPGAAAYLTDALSVLDEIGASRAVWEWVPAQRRSAWNEFDVLGGANPYQRAVVPNALADVLAADFASTCAPGATAVGGVEPPPATGTGAADGDGTTAAGWVIGVVGLLLVLLLANLPRQNGRPAEDDRPLSRTGAGAD